MADSEHADSPIPVAKLVDDPVDADAEGTKSAESSPELMSGVGLAFENAEGFDNGVRQRPLQVEDLPSGSSGELDPAQLRAAQAEFVADLVERHGLATLDLPPSLFYRSDRFRVGQDLGSFLERLVLVDRNENGRRATSTGDDDVLAKVGDLIDHLTQFAAEHPNRNSPAHRQKCTILGTHYPAGLTTRPHCSRFGPA